MNRVLEFLLEEHVKSEEQSREYMAAMAGGPDIDISEELQMLSEAQVAVPRVLPAICF